jgi:hypothetical protein
MSQQGSLVVVCVCLSFAVEGRGQAAPSASARPGVVQIRPRLYEDFVMATASPRDEAQVAALWQQAEHVLAPHDPAVTPHTLAVTRPTLDRLRRAGIEVTLEPTSVQQLVDDSYARYDQSLAAEADAFFSKVQPLEAIEAYLTELVGRAGGRAKLVTIGRSIQGRDIRGLLISSRPDDGARASIIVTAAQHAREWLAPMVAMGIADGLVAGYGGDERVESVVDNLNVYVVPVMNPDGYVRTFNGNRLQRKNMRAGCNIDINRNFPTAFGQRVAKSCDAETTPGSAPFSEPEAQALRALAELQTNLRLYVDYHSAGNQVMIPYAFTRDEPPGLAKNQQWGNLLAGKAMLPARPAFALAQGQGGGSLDWFREKYSESLVVELPGRGFDPPGIGVAASVARQWDGWLAVAELIARENPGRQGLLDGGAPDAAGDAGSSGPSGGDGGAGAADGADRREGGASTHDMPDARARAPGSGGSTGSRDAGAVGGGQGEAGQDPLAGATSGGCAIDPNARGSASRPLLVSVLLALAFCRRRRQRGAISRAIPECSCPRCVRPCR